MKVKPTANLFLALFEPIQYQEKPNYDERERERE